MISVISRPCRLEAALQAVYTRRLSTPRYQRRPARRQRRPGRALPLLLSGLLLGLLLTWAVVRPALSSDHAAEPPPPPGARSPAPPPVDPALLAARLHAHTRLPGGRAAAYALDLNRGVEAAVAPDEVFPAASLFKLPILVEVLRQQEGGRFRPEDTLTISPHNWADGSGVLQARVGEQITIGELTRLMIEASDNIAALTLLELVGADNVNATMRALGLHHTRVQDRHHPTQGADSDSADHITTARDMGLLLAALAEGRVLSPEGTEHAIELLGAPQSRQWLAEPLPWWAKVAHKWGELPGVRHDAGLVYTPDHRWVVVVLTAGLEDQEAGRAAIRGVSRALFDLLEQGKS